MTTLLEIPEADEADARPSQQLPVLGETRVSGIAPVSSTSNVLPPILEGCYTLAVEEKVRRFVLGVPELLERWISRRASPHTQRAYRQDLETFIAFAKIIWPAQATDLFGVTIAEVQAYRDWLIVRGDAPKTVNRRVSSLSGFYRFLREVAAEMRLPIQVANPADKEFVGRDNADPVEERRHLRPRASIT